MIAVEPQPFAACLRRGNAATLLRAGSPRRLRPRAAKVHLLAATLSVASTAAEAQSCTISTADGSFGTVDILAGTAADSSSTFTVNCTGTANATVRLCLEFGAGNNPVSGNRVMYSGANTIRNEFYTTSARSTIWGSWGYFVTPAYPTASPAGVTSSLTLSGSGTGSRTFTVYTSVLANQQTARPGTYSWTSGRSPGMGYAYGTPTCPTGATTSSSGSTWVATINADCNVSATNVNFGSDGILNANKDATGTVTVQCTNTTPYSVGLSAGTAPGATVAARRMRSAAGASVTYSLYADSGRSTVWGNTVSTDTQSGTGTGNSQALTVYGRVPSQTTPAPATYTDTITVTITY